MSPFPSKLPRLAASVAQEENNTVRLATAAKRRWVISIREFNQVPAAVSNLNMAKSLAAQS
jgi:hypothetical protein